jgi:AraC-like DNA-binding protein
VKFLDKAAQGTWALRGIVRNVAELSSPMFYSTFEIVSPAGHSAAFSYFLVIPIFAGLFILMVIIIKYWRVKDTAVPAQDLEVFAKFKKAMEDNLSKELGRSEIENLTGMPYSAVFRSIKTVTKKTPVSFLLQLRIDKVKALLKNTDHSVKEIMMEAGFFDPAHFSKIFKKYTGMSPSEFREKS